MGEQLDADEGMTGVGHHEPPREMLAESQFEDEEMPSIGRDCCTFSRKDVVDALPALWKV
jgi:hypothetical protein